MTSEILVSSAPEYLDTVGTWEVGIELKLDWEHETLLRGEQDFGALLDESGVAPGQIESVHLPPGLGRDGSEVKMALTEHNRGAITSFVHEQLGAVPDARLVVHPPKSFDVAAYLDLVATMLELTGRELAVENPPVESDWYTPETIAFFGFAGATYDRLDGLALTIDTGHLPAFDRIDGLYSLDESAMGDLESRLADSGLELPDAFRDWATDGLADLDSYLPDDGRRPESCAYAPSLKTLCMAGPATAEVHLNDPVTDEVPAFGSHDGRPLLSAVVDCIRDRDASIVFEPGTLSTSELRERVTALQDSL